LISLLFLANRNDWPPPQQKPQTATLPFAAGSLLNEVSYRVEIAGDNSASYSAGGCR
jgi:hypothetical protein